MSERVVVLGAAFAGLELSTMLSQASVEVALIDRSDAFVFGYSKLDVMFGRMSREAGLIGPDPSSTQVGGVNSRRRVPSARMVAILLPPPQSSSE